MVDIHCHIELDELNNIEEILETENLIEELENSKKNHEESIGLRKRAIKINNTNNILVVISSIIIGFIISLFIPNFIGNEFRMWITPLLMIETFGLLSPIIFNNMKENKNMKNEICGSNLVLKKIDEQLEKNKELLISLNDNKTKENENKAKNMMQFKKINKLTKLKELREYLALYCSIGANQKEFKKYYKEDTIDYKLGEYFKQSEIETIKTYFKSKKAK